MKIKFHDIYKGLSNKNEIEKKIISLIRSNSFIGGKPVDEFEKKFAKFTKSNYCISVGNGTDALEIALEALKVKKGSEVIVPVNTWISTAEIVLRNGLKLVFCDINLDDYSINLQDLQKKISKKTKVIIPVHLYGNPSDMINIVKLGKKIILRLLKIVLRHMEPHLIINTLELLENLEHLVFIQEKTLEPLEMVDV